MPQLSQLYTSLVWVIFFFKKINSRQIYNQILLSALLPHGLLAMAALGQLTKLRSLRSGFQRVAQYYVKPKEKRGPSVQAWLALAGVSTALLGTGVYVLGELS